MSPSRPQRSGPRSPGARALDAGVGMIGGGLSADFWRLWGSAAFANLADGILFIAIQLIAVRLGASPADLAALVIAGRVPMLALGLIAGGLADRIDRRHTMLAVQVMRTAVAAWLLALATTDGLSLLALTAAALALGVGEAFFDTNAQSLVPIVAGRERLVAANGRLAAVETVMNTFVGPPIGAFLVAMSVPIALTSAAAGFALAALGLVLLSGTFRPATSAIRRGLLTEIGEGVHFLARHSLLRTLTSMVALQHFGVAALFTLLALYALAPGPMGLTEPEFGLLFVTVGAGSLLGSFITGTLVARLGRRRVLLLSTLVLGAGLLVPALTANVAAVGVGNFAIGLALMTFGVTNMSLRQALLPAALTGRVHATYRTTGYLAGVVGAALAGAVGELVGLREAFALGAALVMLGLLGGFVVTEPRISAAEAAATLGRIDADS